uniref:Protein kinase domain-containing protein n=1 Tax=Acrobeloides nanus TaxID=290746 RepID=A0A914EM99_9BILA
MHISSEEIAEMKEKSDEFMILRKNLHVYFDVILGKGVSSTVYKGHLLGTAPLHEQQHNMHTEKFVDCDVAVKVSNRFGQSEVEELFKEIQAMKLIEYHENVVC